MIVQALGSSGEVCEEIDMRSMHVGNDEWCARVRVRSDHVCSACNKYVGAALPPLTKCNKYA